MLNDQATAPTVLLRRYVEARQQSLAIAECLSVEDMQIQAVEETSPTKWHLAHTTWFFETFILNKFVNNYIAFNSHFEFLFNSYYNGIGAQFDRSKRGLLTRPSIKEVFDYREYVDTAISEIMMRPEQYQWQNIAELIELGINHEEQHQELMLTDIKFNLFQNPIYPSIIQSSSSIQKINSESSVLETCSSDLTIDEGVYEIGFSGEGFCFDNEQPLHKQYLSSARISQRLVSNGEFLNFIQDGGYGNPKLWLDDGWSWVCASQKTKPLYWVLQEDSWFEYGFSGLKPIDKHRPIKHINYYEASAFAEWQGKRLPTEAEWEVAVKMLGAEYESSNLMSLEPESIEQSHLWIGELWQWTRSSYHPYPGFKAATGAVGEYNGKFMCNQFVLRGGSRLTPRKHLRFSYRNFFHPTAAWQYSGIRLAEDVKS